MTSPITNSTKRPPLGEILVNEGVIDVGELKAALEYKEERGMKLGQALVALHMVTSSELAHALRGQGHFSCIDLSPGLVDPIVARSLGAVASRRMQAIAINRIAGFVTVAMEDPSEAYDVDAISVSLSAPVLAVHADPDKIARCLDLIFPAAVELELTAHAGVDSTLAASTAAGGAEPADATADDSSSHDAKRVSDTADDLLRGAIADAWSAGAKSIHLDSRGENLLVRLRVDGSVTTKTTVPAALHLPILERLRAWTGSKAAPGVSEVENVRVSLDGATLDLRITIAPGAGARPIRIRLAELGRAPWRLETLGLSEASLRALCAVLDRATGLLLVSAGVDQGLSTTLAAIGSHLAAREALTAFVTPSLEFSLAAVTMLEAASESDHDIANGIRAAQDLSADIIVVDRLAGPESMQAVRAALTKGSFVVAGECCAVQDQALALVGDAGIPTVFSPGMLVASLHQALGKRLCTNCRRACASDESNPPVAGRRQDDGPFFSADGCTECRGRGWAGRTLAAEFRALGCPPRGSTREDGQRDARSETTLYSAVLGKALAGELHSAEISRLLGPDFEVRP